MLRGGLRWCRGASTATARRRARVGLPSWLSPKIVASARSTRRGQFVQSRRVRQPHGRQETLSRPSIRRTCDKWWPKMARARKSPARPGRCASPSTPTTGRPPCNCSTASRGLRWFCSMGADVDGLGTGLCMKPGSIIDGALASSSRTAHRAAHATPSRRCGFGTPSPLDKNQSLPRPPSELQLTEDPPGA